MSALPEATFLAFCSGMATQALMQLGEVPFPDSGERRENLPYARYTTDVLKILRAKAEGNLSDEERSYLDAAIEDLETRCAQKGV
ncbi:MAG: DUF1844 domain-containing protein [Planctomycetota bacterium]|nr:MAG: DUF1844 domain-containing protein [Planctomycetota bacterium]